MKSALILILALAALVAVPIAASAATVTLQASQDTSLYKGSATQLTFDNNGGGANGLLAGNNAMGLTRRGIVQFDVAGSLPAGAVIQSAQLTMRLAQSAGTGMGGGSGTFDVSLHRMTSTWGEGTKQAQNPKTDNLTGQGAGLPATTGEATWNSRFHAQQLWNTAGGGGDFLAQPSATVAVGSTINTNYSWLTNAALVSDVQSWFDSPATNAGWLIKNADEINAATVRGFYSRDVFSQTFRPQLTITYVPEPATASIAGALMLSLAAVRRAQSPRAQRRS